MSVREIFAEDDLTSATQTISPSLIGATDLELQRRVGDAVRLFRTLRHFTQRDLAEKIGRSQNLVGSIERGETEAGIVVLLRIADALGVSVYQFVSLIAPARVEHGGDVQRLVAESQEVLSEIIAYEASKREPPVSSTLE